MNTFCCIVSSLLVVCTLCTPFYNDQKQNCTLKHVTGSYCYGGPRFDDVGQYKSCSVPNTMALTFDDGLDTNVPYFLDMLKLFKMKATFFVIGQTLHRMLLCSNEWWMKVIKSVHTRTFIHG